MYSNDTNAKRPVLSQENGSSNFSQVAPSYSPACDSSTIGSTGLNGSVRNGRGEHPPYQHQPEPTLYSSYKPNIVSFFL